MNMQSRKPLIATPAEDRGKLAAENPGEFKFEDTLDYINFVSGQLRRSSMKRKDVAAGGHMSASTVGNMASGQTRYPRFGTMFGIAVTLGMEVVIRGEAKAGPIEPKAPAKAPPKPEPKAMLRALTTRKP